VPERQAVHIFDLMDKFAGYGFNKSHSAAYAVLSFQTAWLKAHYPAAFMAAVMSADMDRTEKVVTLINDCESSGLAVLPPDVNASQYMFTVSDERSIRYGLGAVKGVGQAAVEALVAERVARGPFASLTDLCHRVELQRVNKRALEALIRDFATAEQVGIGKIGPALRGSLGKGSPAPDLASTLVTFGKAESLARLAFAIR
jgi:DNA polymerase-3 subunit alpha